MSSQRDFSLFLYTLCKLHIRARTVSEKLDKGRKKETVYEKRSTDATRITGFAAIIKGLKKSLRYVKEEIDLAAVTQTLNR